MFDLEVRIGNLVRKLTLEGETDIDGNAFCAVEISRADLAQYWYPDAEISVRSDRQEDEIEPIAYERGTGALAGHRNKDDRIPVIFEISRLVH